jgi:hypothetical protein
MARTRNIKPSLFKNEILGEADPLLTILFAGLWCLADCNGVLEARPKRIKAEIFPYRENLNISSFFSELEIMGFIRCYYHAGTPLIQIENFKKHQSPHPSEKPSEWPMFIDADKITDLAVKNNCEQVFKNPSYPSTLPPLNPSTLTSAESASASDEPPKKRKAKKERDPRLDHPAIIAVHEIMARYPSKGLWDRIIRDIGDKPDVEFIRANYELWLSVNGSPLNLEKWLFGPNRTGKGPEIYGAKNEGATNGNFNGRNGKPSNAEVVDQWRAEHERIFGSGNIPNGDSDK